MMKSALKINLDHYENRYSSTNRFITYLRRTLSFDQRYKCKFNWYLLNRWLRNRHIDQVLEIGFGYGLNLMKFSTTVRLVGTDISYSATKSLYKICAKRKQKALLCVNDSIGALPFNTQFDVIICSHVLEHIVDDANILQEFHRLLLPGGALILNVPINEIMPDTKHVHIYDTELINNLLRKAKFKVIEQMTADRWEGFFVWCKNNNLICLRKFLRALCALLPYRFCEWVANHLLVKYFHWQMNILAVHNEK